MPTWNGAATIRDALDSIVAELDGHPRAGEVELLISDNASTDATPEIVQAVAEAHPQLALRYARNDENLGYDRNVDLLFERAHGTHVWLLADDDALLPGAVDRILGVLDAHPDLDVVLLNFDFHDEQLEELIHRMELNGGEDRLCSDGDDFATHASGRFGLMSALLFRVACWKATDLTHAVGRNHIHIHKLFEALPTARSYIVASPVSKARRGSSRFEDSGDSMITVPLELLKVFRSLTSPPYAQATIDRLVADQRKYLFSRLRTASRRGFEHRWRLLADLARHNYDYGPFWSKSRHFFGL